MISRIEGVLIELEDGRAHLRCGGLVYEVLVPAADHGGLTLELGNAIELHTLHLLEGTSQGSSFRPRLIGFATAGDRAFFELFTTVKGIGPRKALRVMEVPPARIARAISEQDLVLLKSLPEVGKRTAEAIVVELKDKVDGFIGQDAGSSQTRMETEAIAEFIEEAIAVLLQLGEPRARAEELIERVTRADPTIDTADLLVTGALRLKQMN
jgi:Holliday junction DNA helicase RuvA